MHVILTSATKRTCQHRDDKDVPAAAAARFGWNTTSTATDPQEHRKRILGHGARQGPRH